MGEGLRDRDAPRLRASARDRELPVDWQARLATGDRRILARALTEVENETAAAEAVLRVLAGGSGWAACVGFTGAPGVGKSTLIDAYVGELRRRGHTVGVVAVDPSSPVSGGAVLGDRARLGRHAADPGVFVRSLASRGHLGGLTRSVAGVLAVMSAAGLDVVVLETVGTGQSEVQIASVAATTVLVCAPGMGDELQALKAGVLEIADVIVVNKADLLPPDATLRTLDEAVRRFPRGGWEVPVIATTATTGDGVAELADAVAGHGARRGTESPSRLNLRQRLQALVLDLARSRVEGLRAAELERLAARLADGSVTLGAAAERVLRGEPPS